MMFKSIENEINLRNKNKLKGYNLFLKNLLNKLNLIKKKNTKIKCKKIIDYLTKNLEKKKFENFHIIRVTYYCLKYADFKYKDQICKLALVHNIYEKKNNSSRLKKLVDKKTLNLAKVLQVNRKKQWEKAYIRSYYEKINNSSSLIKIVKCLDKFDNLFNLHKNPKLKIKKLYLREIELFILPLVKKYLPKLLKYYKKLFEYNLRLIRQ
tara:strand:+ start:324 stop:950 length:627 start_codon:yes stop_codon:yes gene_type:complete